MGDAVLGQGVRLPWAEVPSHVRDAVVELAGDLARGGDVVEARACVGGFSPGAAAALTFAGGGRAFVKAVSTAQNPRTPAIYRDEAAVNAWLPRHPSVPALLGTYDDGDWVALLFEHVDAPTPSLPWVPSDLDAVLRAVRTYQAAAGPVGDVARPIAALYEDEFTAWRAIAADPPDGLDAWSRAQAERLAEIEPSWLAATAGETLLHTDLRADNVLVRGDRAWLVDWPWACAGAAWVDVVLFAPSVSLHGGPPPEEALAATYPDAPHDGVLALVTALAGFFTAAALQPAPPGLPTLRAHQASSARATRDWLARLLAC
jgi:hypothetical protein